MGYDFAGAPGRNDLALKRRKPETQMEKRRSGILLHISSLPSPYGIGDLGPQAYQFVDFLHKTKQTLWQVLPLSPTEPAFGNSPYSSISAFAGNPLLLSPDEMVKEGFLTEREVDRRPVLPEGRCDYPAVLAYKETLFQKAFQRFEAFRLKREEFEAFCHDHEEWLNDYALFSVIRRRFEGRIWNRWPEGLRDRKQETLREVEQENPEALKKEKFLQYLFFKQWDSLKHYGNRQGVKFLGDLPIYVGLDSVDVWVHPHLFKIDKDKNPLFVSGVPPDYFSKDGQLWGNPVYDWDRVRERGFDWWKKRMIHQSRLFDLVRIDHFRGLIAYWEIPAHEKRAVHGKWVRVPWQDFFDAIRSSSPGLSIIAEDLGLITADVKEAREKLALPGMKVLLFAFGEDHPLHPYLPHMYEENCVVYTGTHDNNTVRGWFENEARPEDRKRLFRYLGRDVSKEEVHWELIRLAMMSVARTAIFPMQDVLGLGEGARMNRPATTSGNWEWRLLPGQIRPETEAKLLEMTETYGRG